MNNQDHKDCFGSIFPDSLNLKNNVPNQGKVFTVWMKQLEGSVLPVQSDRSIETDLKQWEACQQCPEFGSCYKLSIAKMALESAIASH